MTVAVKKGRKASGRWMVYDVGDQYVQQFVYKTFEQAAHNARQLAHTNTVNVRGLIAANWMSRYDYDRFILEGAHKRRLDREERQRQAARSEVLHALLAYTA